MADQISLCLIAAMDHLWFHHIILIPEHTSPLASKTLKPTSPTLSLSPSFSEEEISFSSPLEDEEKSSNTSLNIVSCYKDDSNNEDEEKEIMNVKERPTRLNIIRDRTRSQSSSPSTQKRPKNRQYSTSKLQKSMSCRSLVDLELEEVKGFMDLGFRFNKEDLCPRMMSVVPGLQRAKLYKNEENIGKQSDETEEEQDYEKRIIRPYLSEAWLIKRPDSPLLNLKIPKVTAAADMKKHLRFWAKTVASTVQQEC